MAEHFPNKNEGESGYVLVMTIMILAILMISGLMSSSSVTTDIAITRNTIISAQNSSAAESAAMAGVQGLENEKDEEKLQPVFDSTDWINADPYDYKASSADKAEKWADQALNMTSDRRGGASPRYRVIGWNSASGTSLGQYAPSLKECRVIGEYDSDLYGVYRVELGYKKRF